MNKLVYIITYVDGDYGHADITVGARRFRYEYIRNREDTFAWPPQQQIRHLLKYLLKWMAAYEEGRPRPTYAETIEGLILRSEFVEIDPDIPTHERNVLSIQ